MNKIQIDWIYINNYIKISLVILGGGRGEGRGGEERRGEGRGGEKERKRRGLEMMRL